MVNGNPESGKNAVKLPSPWVSVLPLAVLTLLLYVVIRCFGGDAINGGSQIALLSATSVCVMLAIGIYRCKWAVLEEAIIDNIRASASAIIILLLIGAIAGSWMVSGVVPTMIYYGLKILHPSFFLVASCAICAGVSLMTGSSWTTIATIGVALMGIGQAMGFPEGGSRGRSSPAPTSATKSRSCPILRCLRRRPSGCRSSRTYVTCCIRPSRRSSSRWRFSSSRG